MAARRVAFFDIDGTVFRSSLLIELVRAFVRDGVFPPDAEHGYEREFRAWVERHGTYETYINAVVRTFLEHLRGVHYGTLADTGRVVVAEQERHVYRYTRDLLKTLKGDGVYLVAISQSPKTILDEFCQSYGFDKVYGRIYEIGPTDRFTGAIVDEHVIANKANIARRVSEKEGISLSNALGVGDTEGDIPLLELMSEPICFNPNKALYDHAKRMGWKVVVERKDVVYEL
jgi:HAD superfamily phosphoserine phosphatase-like hydrolase